jgi:hypothetical protein
MRSIMLVCFGASAVLATVPLAAQNPNIMHPQEIEVQHHPTPEEIRDRLNYPQFQKDTKDLADLRASLPTDLDGLKRGLVGKDMLDKLKRVEKLSKRVREELSRSGSQP